MSDTQIFDVLLPEEKINRDTGEVEKTYFHRGGTMFAHKQGEGFNLLIPPGMSLSGKVLILPRKGKAESVEPDPAATQEFNNHDA